MLIRIVTLSVAVVLAGSARAGTLIVVNKSDASVSLFEPDTGEELATLAVGSGPHEVAVSPDGRRAVVTNYGTREAPGSTLSVIDLETVEVTATIELGGHTMPHGVVFFDDNERVLVTTEGSRSVLMINAETGEIIAEIGHDGEIGHMVALTPNQNRAFVPNIGSGTLTTINTLPRQTTKTVRTGRTGDDTAGPEGVAVSPDGRRVWVTNRQEGTIAVFDARSLRKVNTLDCPGFPIRVLFTPDGEFAVVSCATDGEVAVYNWRTAELLARVPMLEGMADDQEGRMFAGRGPMPIGILCSPDGRWLYVSNTNADTVTVIDMGALKIDRRIETRKEPDGLGWTELDIARDAG